MEHSETGSAAPHIVERAVHFRRVGHANDRRAERIGASGAKQEDPTDLLHLETAVDRSRERWLASSVFSVVR